MAAPQDPNQQIPTEEGYIPVPSGFKFKPKDKEILFLLKNKIEDPHNYRFEPMITEVIDFYEQHPSDLLHGNGDKENKVRYFFTKRSRNKKRRSEKGNCKIRTMEEISKHPSINVKIGSKRGFTFYNAPGATVTNTTEGGTLTGFAFHPRSEFLMHEYQFDEEYQITNIMIKEEENQGQKGIKIQENSTKNYKLDDDEFWVVCKVYENPRYYLRIDEKSTVDFAKKCIEDGFDFGFGDNSEKSEEGSD